MLTNAVNTGMMDVHKRIRIEDDVEMLVCCKLDLPGIAE